MRQLMMRIHAATFFDAAALAFRRSRFWQVYVAAIAADAATFSFDCRC